MGGGAISRPKRVSDHIRALSTTYNIALHSRLHRSSVRGRAPRTGAEDGISRSTGVGAIRRQIRRPSSGRAERGLQMR